MLYRMSAVLLHRNQQIRNRQISLRIKRPPSQRISNEMAVNIFIMV